MTDSQQLKPIIDGLRDMQIALSTWIGRLEAMMDGPATLQVPYRSQWDPDGTKFRSDCGPASLAMVLQYYGTRVDIDQLAVESKMTSKQPYTIPGDLIECAAKHNLNLARHLGMTLDVLKIEIAAGRPVIALVHYGDLTPIVQDKAFKRGHWFVVTGIDEQSVVVNDSNWWEPLRNRGERLAIPIDMFTKAWGDCHLDSNSDYQALVVKPD